MPSGYEYLHFSQKNTQKSKKSPIPPPKKLSPCQGGRAFGNARAIPKDYVEAYKWILLAERYGEDVAESKSRLEAEMNPAQIAEGQKLAQEYIEQKQQDKLTDKPDAQNTQ